MSCTRSEIVAQARSWLGLKESDGSFKTIIDTYNSHKPLARGYKLKYTDEWCSGFASAVAIACGATDIIPTEVGCGKHIQKFQEMGIWEESDAYVPRPADYIFYDWKDDGKGENTDGASHVGIVETVDNGIITVIEGNKNEAVARRTIQVNGKYVRGYGVPKYADEEAEPVEVTYQAYAGGRWLGKITGYNEVDSNGYAGVFGRAISGLRVRLSNGKDVTLWAHISNAVGVNGLLPITEWDCVAMKAEGVKLRYRVHIKGGKWLPWVTGFDIGDDVNGYAGVLGKPIDAVQIDVVK